MRYCLDTSIAILIVGGHPSCVRRLGELDAGSAFMSMIVWAELQAGAQRESGNAKVALAVLDRFAAAVPMLAFDDEAARAYGALFQRASKRRNSFDRLIAAHAIAAQATLVTANGSDVADIPGLCTENWTLP